MAKASAFGGLAEDVDDLFAFLHSFLMLLTDMRVPRSLGFIGKVSRSSTIESAENRLEGGLETSLTLSGKGSSPVKPFPSSEFAANEDTRSGRLVVLVGKGLALSEDENRPNGSGESGITGESVDALPAFIIDGVSDSLSGYISSWGCALKSEGMLPLLARKLCWEVRELLAVPFKTSRGGEVGVGLALPDEGASCGLTISSPRATSVAYGTAGHAP